MANVATHIEPAVSALPPLDGFTRAELCELIRILHGGLVRAQADYLELTRLTNDVVAIADALAPPAVAT